MSTEQRPGDVVPPSGGGPAGSGGAGRSDGGGWAAGEAVVDRILDHGDSVRFSSQLSTALLALFFSAGAVAIVVGGWTTADASDRAWSGVGGEGAALVLAVVGLVLAAATWWRSRRRGRLVPFLGIVLDPPTTRPLDRDEKRVLGRAMRGTGVVPPEAARYVRRSLELARRRDDAIIPGLLGVAATVAATALVTSAALFVFCLVGCAVIAGIVALERRWRRRAMAAAEAADPR